MAHDLYVYQKSNQISHHTDQQCALNPETESLTDHQAVLCQVI